MTPFLVTERCSITSAASRSAVPLAQYSVYVLLPRYREGLPRTVLGAMAMGRAIITTDASCRCSA